MDETHASTAASAASTTPAARAEPANDRDAQGAGALVMLGTGPAVRFERVLNSPAEAVWRALTEPEELRGWFPCEISVDRWEVGASLTFSFPGHAEFTMDGVVLECDPPRTLAYLWGEETLRFQLDTDSSGSGGTRLVMTDEMAASIAARNAAGWHVCLDLLAGKPSPEGDEGWRTLFARYCTAFEPTLGPQEGPPEGMESSE